MTLVIRFEPIRVGSNCNGEEAYLGLANEQLVTVLVRLPNEDDPSVQDSWYLETGFGPCDREGLIFSTLSAAEAWIRRCMPKPDQPAI